MNFTMLTYLDEFHFLSKEGKKLKVFGKNDSEQIIEAFKAQSDHFARRETAKKLQDAFNAAIKTPEIYSKFVAKLIDKMNNEVYNKMVELGLMEQTNTGTIKLKGSLKDLTDLVKKNGTEQELRNLVSKIGDGQHKNDEIEKIIVALNSSLNKMRGDIFENLLAIVLDQVAISANNIVDTSLEDLTAIITQAFNKDKRSMPMTAEGIYKGKKAKVVGGKITSPIEITVYGNKIILQGAQGKTDVVVPGLNGLEGISAKNYKDTNRRISLLSKGNVAALITLWPGVSEIEKNIAMNGLSAKSISRSQFNVMKNIFLIQSLMGAREDDIKSQYLIINTNRKENPILIFSIYDLLFEQHIQGKGSLDSSETIQNALNIIPRNKEQFLNFVRSATISIKTQMTISAMEKMYSQGET